MPQKWPLQSQTALRKNPQTRSNLRDLETNVEPKSHHGTGAAVGRTAKARVQLHASAQPAEALRNPEVLKGGDFGGIAASAKSAALLRLMPFSSQVRSASRCGSGGKPQLEPGPVSAESGVRRKER